MSRTTNRITGMLAASLLAAALVPATSGASQDQRSADAVDAGVVHNGRSYYQDERSADAVDTSAVGSSLTPASTTQSGGSSDGVDWGDVALIGGGVLSLALIAFGGRALFVRHARAVEKSRTPVVSS
jgi:hypothetical protein